MTQFSVNTTSKLSEIESHLAKHPFLADSSLPGAADARIFNNLTFVPDRKIHPNFFYWYRFIKQFSLEALKSWEAREIKLHSSNTNMEVIEENSGEDASYTNSPEKGAIARLMLLVKPSNPNESMNKIVKMIQNMNIDGVVWESNCVEVKEKGNTRRFQMRCEVALERTSVASLVSRIEMMPGVSNVIKRDFLGLDLFSH